MKKIDSDTPTPVWFDEIVIEALISTDLLWYLIMVTHTWQTPEFGWTWAMLFLK